MNLTLPTVRPGPDGLIPVVARERRSGDVLMVAWADDEALRATALTGQAHFHSRSRDALWRKGETSGNVLTVHAIGVDCDGDTVLYDVDVAGPACHTGSRTCFGDQPRQGFAWLEALWDTIAARAVARPDDSYTARLLAGGVAATTAKVTEEAAEVVEAAELHAAGVVEDARLAEEAADLIYHLLVTLAERGVDPSLVVDVLVGRRG